MRAIRFSIEARVARTDSRATSFGGFRLPAPITSRPFRITPSERASTSA
jgi:hypothetical protein